MTAENASQLRVLVTAAGGGAGRVIAKRFHASGAAVLACDIEAAGIRSLEEECDGLVGVHADAGEERSVAAIVEKARERFGGVDVLVNNVGIAGPTLPAEDITLDAWNESLRINLTSHFLFARGVIPFMKAERRGLIVNISSGSAKTAPPLRLPYVVTKGALLSMTVSLARELGPHGIRVNAILPGAIRGARIERVINAKAKALGVDPKQHERDLLRYISLRCMVEPDDIAAMIQFLASSAGQRITGQLIGVDGNIEWEE